MNREDIKQYMIKLIITILTMIIIALFTFGILYSNKIIDFIKSIISILMPFVYGGCIAYLLTPLCNKIKYKLINKKVKHYNAISIAITEIILAIIIIVACSIILPQSILSVGKIVKEMPSAVDSTQVWIDKQLEEHLWIRTFAGNHLDDIEHTATNIIKSEIIPNLESILNSVITSATSVGKVILNITIGIFVNIFALANRENFAKYMQTLIYAVFGEKISNLIIEEVLVANKMFSGFFFGKIVDSTIIGIICFISLVILDMPYALLVSVIVGITNIIPIIGPFIGAVPGVIIIFSDSTTKALYFIVFIFLLQQLDGNYIEPKCIGSATNLSTFWVLFAIIFFGGLWGIVGMIIGVPLLAVIFDIINKTIDRLLYMRESKTDENLQEGK